MKAFWILLALAGAACAQTTAATLSEQVKASLMRVRTGAPRLRYNHATDFGTVIKTAAVPLVNQAVSEVPPQPVQPWMPISGYKLYLAWRANDSKYFTGETLFDRIGKQIWKIPAQTPIDAMIDQQDGSQGTFREAFAVRYNHSQPGIPSALATPLADDKLTAASVANVLEAFPWTNPTNPCHKITPQEFDQLKTIWYEYRKEHMKAPITSFLLPFMVVKIPGLTQNDGYLLKLEQAIDVAAVRNGARPMIRLPASVEVNESLASGGPAANDRAVFKFNDVDPSSWYGFRVSYTYYFQEVPSVLDIPLSGVAALPQRSLRNPGDVADFDGPMTILSGGTAAATAINKDDNIHTKMLDPTFLDALAGQPVPEAYHPRRRGYDPGLVNYFKKVQAGGPATGDFVITKRDLDLLNTNPASSRLAVVHSPHPTVSFNPEHFGDVNTDEMEKLLRTAAPPVPTSKMRQGSMQVYVRAKGAIYKSGLADPASVGTGTPVAEFDIVDDCYLLTQFTPDPYKDETELNKRLVSDCVRGGGYAVGDPFKRTPAPATNIRLTPARVDTQVRTAEGPSDSRMSYFPDPRRPGDAEFLATAEGKAGAPEAGNVNSLGNAFFEAHVGRGPAYNFVYDKDGAKIDPNRPEKPHTYWPNARHVAVIWPYRVRRGTDEFVVGPYVLNLDSVEKTYKEKARNRKYQYIYAEPPWHATAEAANDRCTPVVLTEPLRGIINRIYEESSIAEVHMTAKASTRWGKPMMPGNTPNYQFAADLSIADANEYSVNSLVLRVPLGDLAIDSYPLLPNPGSFIPLDPQFPTFQGGLPDTLKRQMDPQLTRLPDGYDPAAARDRKEFVASYDARRRTSGPEGSATTPGSPGLPPGVARVRSLLSNVSLDQTVKIQVVDGCGNIDTLAQAVVVGASVARPSASVTFIPSDEPQNAYTVGVPIASKHFIQGNEGAQFFTQSVPKSLSGRINDINRPLLVGNLSAEFDGTAPPGTDKNPGDEFFRPPDPNKNRVVKGRAVRMEIVGESVVPPGYDLYDLDNELADRALFKARPYASFIRKMDLSVFPPSGNGAATEPEKKINLFYFNTGVDLGTSNAMPTPPVATVEYVFRESTGVAAAEKGKPLEGNRHYVVRVDIEDIGGNTRALKFPVFVTDEGLATDKLSTEHQRK